MSTTMTKRTHRQALEDAIDFRDLFPVWAYARWEIAGSIRRRKPEVADVEHVVIPAFGGDPANLFAPPTINLLWKRLDELVAAGALTKHVYGATGNRWGDKYRGVDFRGFNHELFTADADNWGSVSAIRTGPAEFSQRMVTELRQQGRRNKDGYVWECRPCGCGRRDDKCKLCDGTGLEPVSRLSVGDEAHYLNLCGMKWIEPEARR